MDFLELLIYTSQLRVGSRISGTWSQAEHLLADQVDLLNHIRWTNTIGASAWVSDEKVFKNPPEPLERPGVEALEDEEIEDTKFSSLDQIQQVFGAVYAP